MQNNNSNNNNNNRSTMYSTNAAVVHSSTNHISTSMPPVIGGLQKKSLNKDSRKRELLKITMENQAILRRLQDKQSSYNVGKWVEEEQERKRILKNICEYPYQIDVPGQG